jgi:molybdopterin-guanine dinucleotide biosynthesis protein A
LNLQTGHPVFMPWHWVEEHRLHDAAMAPTRRLDELIRPHAIRVPVDDPAVLVNINTPEDLKRWEAMRRT